MYMPALYGETHKADHTCHPFAPFSQWKNSIGSVYLCRCVVASGQLLIDIVCSAQEGTCVPDSLHHMYNLHINVKQT